jgi:hypothetical protein
MSANRNPGYKCPYCKARFVRPFGFRTGREWHVRNYHLDRWTEFCAERKAGLHGVGDWDSAKRKERAP